LAKLGEDERHFRELRLMIEFSEMGRFSEARNLLEAAGREFDALLKELEELRLSGGVC